MTDDEIVALAYLKTGKKPKDDRGWNYACYCPVCCAIRKEERPVRVRPRSLGAIGDDPIERDYVWLNDGPDNFGSQR